jgi:hypothetical protein
MAVEMISGALTLLLTGEILPWREARLVFANGEALLGMMNDAMTRRDALPAARLRMMTRFTE